MTENAYNVPPGEEARRDHYIAIVRRVWHPDMTHEELVGAVTNFDAIRMMGPFADAYVEELTEGWRQACPVLTLECVIAALTAAHEKSTTP